MCLNPERYQEGYSRVWEYNERDHIKIKRKTLGTQLLFLLQPQIRKSWDSMENANKKRK